MSAENEWSTRWTDRDALHEEVDPGDSAERELGTADFASDGHGGCHKVGVEDAVKEVHAEGLGEGFTRGLEQRRTNANDDADAHDKREEAHVRPNYAAVRVNVTRAVVCQHNSPVEGHEAANGHQETERGQEPEQQTVLLHPVPALAPERSALLPKTDRGDGVVSGGGGKAAGLAWRAVAVTDGAMVHYFERGVSGSRLTC